MRGMDDHSGPIQPYISSAGMDFNEHLLINVLKLLPSIQQKETLPVCLHATPTDWVLFSGHLFFPISQAGLQQPQVVSLMLQKSLLFTPQIPA